MPQETVTSCTEPRKRYKNQGLAPAASQTKAPNKRSSKALGSGGGGGALYDHGVDASRTPEVDNSSIGTWIEDGYTFEYMKNSIPAVTLTPAPYTTPLQGLSSDQRSTSTNSPRLRCPSCSKDNFRDKSKLDDHMRSHSQERPFLCPEPRCPRDFKYERDKVKHEKTCEFKGQNGGYSQSQLSLSDNYADNIAPPPPHPPPQARRVPNNTNSQSQHTPQSETRRPTVTNVNGGITRHPSSPLPPQSPHGGPLTGVGAQLAVQFGAQSLHPSLDLNLGEGARRVRDSRIERIGRSISNAIQASQQIDDDYERQQEDRQWLEELYPDIAQWRESFGGGAEVTFAMNHGANASAQLRGQWHFPRH